MVQPWKKPSGKAKALEFEKKKALRDTLTRAASCGLLHTREICRSDCDHGKIYNCTFTRHNMLSWGVLEHFKERQTKCFGFLYLGSLEKIRLLRNWNAMPYDPSGSASVRFSVRMCYNWTMNHLLRQGHSTGSMGQLFPLPLTGRTKIVRTWAFL